MVSEGGNNAMARFSKTLPLVILLGVTVGVLVGCPPPEQPSLTVVNYTTTELNEVNLKDVSEDNWGPNQLDGFVVPGDGSEEYTVLDIPKGVYDLRAVFNTPPACNNGKGRIAVYRFEVPISEGAWEWIFSLLQPADEACIVVDTLRAALIE
jgi:hypothetical protein